MTKRHPFSPALLGALVSALVACQNTPTHSSTDRTLELEYDQDSPWEYYSEKYDRDADGSVSEEEYDAERSATFARLDRSGDGLLSQEDFTPSGGDMRAMEIEMRALRALFEYLQEAPQADEEAAELTMDELFFAAESYDANGDETLNEGEFRRLADSRYHAMPKDDMARMLGERDPWEALLEGLDTDADGALAFPELETFFATLDDGDFVLYFTLEDPRGGTTAREPQSGPRVGAVAPDFELLPPAGGDPVRLSDFAGDRPVALIFGSYT